MQNGGNEPINTNKTTIQINWLAILILVLAVALFITLIIVIVKVNNKRTKNKRQTIDIKNPKYQLYKELTNKSDKEIQIEIEQAIKNKTKNEEQNKTEETAKSGTIITFLYVLILLGIIAFTVFLPYLWWEVNWEQLFTIVFSKDKNIQTANDITKIMQAFGLTDKTLHSWAFERILICIGIMIVLITFASIIYCKIKQKSKNKEK